MSDSEHTIHSDHPRTRSRRSHPTIQHDNHVDYLRDGHLHHPHNDHVDEHALEVSHTNPAGCTPEHDCGEHDAAVVELLAREGQCLLTAQEISDLLRAERSASPASVYRVLDELFELGLLPRLDGRVGVARFEIADPERHHHHVVDESTARLGPSLTRRWRKR